MLSVTGRRRRIPGPRRAGSPAPRSSGKPAATVMTSSPGPDAPVAQPRRGQRGERQEIGGRTGVDEAALGDADEFGQALLELSAEASAGQPEVETGVDQADNLVFVEDPTRHTALESFRGRRAAASTDAGRMRPPSRGSRREERPLRARYQIRTRGRHRCPVRRQDRQRVRSSEAARQPTGISIRGESTIGGSEGRLLGRGTVLFKSRTHYRSSGRPAWPELAFRRPKRDQPEHPNDSARPLHLGLLPPGRVGEGVCGVGAGVRWHGR